MTKTIISAVMLLVGVSAFGQCDDLRKQVQSYELVLTAGAEGFTPEGLFLLQDELRKCREERRALRKAAVKNDKLSVGIGLVPMHYVCKDCWYSGDDLYMGQDRRLLRNGKPVVQSDYNWFSYDESERRLITYPSLSVQYRNFRVNTFFHKTSYTQRGEYNMGGGTYSFEDAEVSKGLNVTYTPFSAVPLGITVGLAHTHIVWAETVMKGWGYYSGNYGLSYTIDNKWCIDLMVLIEDIYDDKVAVYPQVTYLFN